MRPQPNFRRRGNVMVTFAISIGVLLGASALVIDLGELVANTADLQAAADAAAHAGALQLDGTATGLQEATRAAVSLGGQNQVAGQALRLDPARDVELGTWDTTHRSFTEGGTAPHIDAVRVVAARDDLFAWFSHVAFGHTSLSASAESVALRRLEGASATSCFLPLAVPSCVIENVGMPAVNLVDLVLNPPGTHNVGWVRPDTNPSASWLSSQLRDCSADGEVAVGDPVNLNNGVIGSVLSDVATEIAHSDTTWQTSLWGTQPAQNRRSAIPTSAYGHTLEGPILVFDDDSYCSSAGRFVETVAVAGFVWASIYEVVNTGPAAGKTLRVRLETRKDYDLGTEGGGTDYGVVATTVGMVR